MPQLEEKLERAGNSWVLIKLDLAKQYYQVQIEGGSKYLTASISLFGKLF